MTAWKKLIHWIKAQAYSPESRNIHGKYPANNGVQHKAPKKSFISTLALLSSQQVQL
jgi:hypothetical protein